MNLLVTSRMSDTECDEPRPIPNTLVAWREAIAHERSLQLTVVQAPVNQEAGAASQ